MTRKEEERYEQMEVALKVIRTWAGFYAEKPVSDIAIIEMLRSIRDKCEEALK